MTDDLDPSPEDIARIKAKLEAMTAKPTPEDAAEKKMIASLLGTKTQAEDFLRHERRKPVVGNSRIELRYPKPFKSRPPILRFEYWERADGPFGHSEWIIERYENGKLVHEHRGQDWQKRDGLLIKLQAAGYTCTPVTVAGLVPEPIKGRLRDRRKQPSGRFDIISKIGKLTTDDLEDYDD